MDDLNDIARHLYDICYEVDRSITGLSEEDAKMWAKANSVRHAHTTRVILSHIQKNLKQPIRILNASGLSCGHQDFSICDYLRKKGIDFSWDVYESPSSKYLCMRKFQEYCEKFGIAIHLSDFSNDKALYGENAGEFDVVIFTEIAEHLDHSTFLAAISAIERKLKSSGQLILTTPNLTSLINRIRIFLGNGDGPYWGDGSLNRQAGLYGHITIYDISRITRLLSDVGLKSSSAYTFTAGRGPIEKDPLKNIIFKLIDLCSHLIHNSGSTLFIQAEKGVAVRIPLDM